MKNYDIKSATAELSLKQKIVVNSKRIAFLVPNMFNKLKSGFVKKVKGIVGGAQTLANNVSEGVHTAVQNVVASEEVKTALSEAQVARDVKNIEKALAVETKIEAKEEAMQQVQANPNIDDDTKSYIIKAYQSDIDRLTAKSARVSTAPRRLLISTVFIQKLFTNRRNKKIQNKIEKKLENVPSVEEVAVQDVETAKEKYLSLNEERMALMAQIKKIQDDMTGLVNDFGLTKEMFEENSLGKTK